MSNTCRRCEAPRIKGRQLCSWHVIADLPLLKQLECVTTWRAQLEARPGFTYRARVPAAQWPPGHRWCSDCQGYVPLWFAQGSKCKPHARAGARGGHVERTYGVERDVEAGLRRWQAGRCFVCGRQAVRRELAVDHDHTTGAVRGLLCSDDEYGCNTSLRRILGDLAAAQRLLLYVEKSPLQRYLDGEPPPFG